VAAERAAAAAAGRGSVSDAIEALRLARELWPDLPPAELTAAASEILRFLTAPSPASPLDEDAELTAAAIAARYKQGATLKRLAHQKGVSTNTIRRMLLSHGVELRPITERQRAHLLRMRQSRRRPPGSPAAAPAEAAPPQPAPPAPPPPQPAPPPPQPAPPPPPPSAPPPPQPAPPAPPPPQPAPPPPQPAPPRPRPSAPPPPQPAPPPQRPITSRRLAELEAISRAIEAGKIKRMPTAYAVETPQGARAAPR
jgi:hypothetical protein